MELRSAHYLYGRAEAQLGESAAHEMRNYALSLQESGLPVIFSLRHLARIANVDYRVLHATVSRKREKTNYQLFAIKKHSGGRRFIHAPSGTLSIVHEFINREILRNVSPHPAAFSFHPGGGIRRCAQMHCSAKWILHFDLADFFHHITEMEVFEVFRNMGYKPLLAFELARLCTTTRLPRRLQYLCKFPERRLLEESVPYGYSGCWGVLPQGTSTSPMLSNLAARSLDESLSSYGKSNGFVYTRYADDLVLSAVRLPAGKSIRQIRKEVVQIIFESNFVENKKKYRVAGPGSRKIVLGLLVDGEEPRVSREMVRRIDRYLHASKKYGVVDVAAHEGFETAYGFYNHLSGLIAYVKDVDGRRWERFDRRLRDISSPLNAVEV